MLPTLETLDLTPAERQRAEEFVRNLAYDKWLRAGRPIGQDQHFWCEAEQEWILFQYVPHRLPPQAVGDDADADAQASHVTTMSAEPTVDQGTPTMAGSVS